MTIEEYIAQYSLEDSKICIGLFSAIESVLCDKDSKIWHGHPVWFIKGNPIVGFSKQKAGWRLMFWSGIDFEEPNLKIHGKKFKDASIFYQNSEDINFDDLNRWLSKSMKIQWDYKNIVKRKGELVRLY